MDNLLIKIKKIAEKNPEGFTVDLDLNPVPEIGFSVSVPETQNSFSDEDLEKVIRTAQELNCCIGGWLNHEDGKYYYDASIVVYDQEEAIRLAKRYGQFAIFDLENKVDIWT